MTALELGKKIRERELSAEEAVKSVLETIEKKESSLHCYVTVLKEQALQRAKLIQKEIDNGECRESPLLGVPFAVKDNICTKGVLTTCSSKMLSDFLPPYSATAVERLEHAGAILIGKTNMKRASAAVVASGEAYFSISSDVGGSIRQSSSFCGVTGIKPTYGMVSRYGLITYASSFDQIGPIGHDVSDCAAVLEVIAGRDWKDAASVSSSFSLTDWNTKSIDKLRIGILRNSYGACESVRRAVSHAADLLKNLGVQIEEVTFELSDYVVPAYSILTSAEASSNLARYDGIRYGYRRPDQKNLPDLYKENRTEGFGLEVRRCIMMGTFVLSPENYESGYQKAQKVRMKIKNAYDSIFEKYDVLISASTPHTVSIPERDESIFKKQYMENRYTAAANLAGFPSMSIPCGFDENGLPIGLSVSSKPFGEKNMLRIAYAYEQIRKGDTI